VELDHEEHGGNRADPDRPDHLVDIRP